MNNTCDCGKKNTKTNGERIRTMDNENLAWLLMEFRFDSVCKAAGGEAALPDTQAAIVKWLGQVDPNAVAEGNSAC